MITSSQSYTECALLLRQEIELLERISALQIQVRNAIVNREWTDFEDRFESLAVIGDEFEALDLERAEAFARFAKELGLNEEDAPFYRCAARLPEPERQELSGLYRRIKMRTMEVIPHMVMMESFGAMPVPVAFPELYTSLQTNVVDGQENMLMNIEAQKFYQVQKYVSMTGHTIDMGTIVIGDKYFRSLPDDIRAALIEAEGVAQLAFSSTAALFDSVGVTRLTKQGMQFNYLTPEQIKVFRDRCVPAVREYLDKELSKEFVDRFMKSVDDAKQSIIDESKVN